MEATDVGGGYEQRIDPDGWDGALATADGPQIVVGGPGTGKTEFLVRRALHLAANGPTERMLILSFGRRGVADLGTRIRSGLAGSVGGLDVTTFHAFADRVLERHYAARGWSGPPVVLTGPEHIELVAQLLRTEDPAGWSPAFRGVLASRTFATEVTDFILRLREQLIDAPRLHELAEDRADWKGLAPFLTRYELQLRESTRIDYGTLLSEAIACLEIDEVSADVVGRYDHVLVDEYQDTTVSQATLLERLTRRHRNLTVAADPYQSVYSFRGAELENVARFPHDFRDLDERPATRLVLTTSFRTPAEILAAAERVASSDLPGAAGPVTPAGGDGRVDVHVFDQETEEAEWIASEAVRLRAGGTPYSAMAVFVRSKRRFLKELSRALARRDVPHDPPDSRLADQPAVRFLFDLVIAAAGDSEAETARAVRRMLLGPMFRLPLGQLRDVVRHAIGAGAGWPKAVATSVPDGETLAELLTDSSWATDRPAIEGFWEVWQRLPQLADIVNDDERRAERAAWASLAQVLGRWTERNPTTSLDDYRTLTEQEDFEARPLLSFVRPVDDRLTLTTLHQSKGLEFDVVFIADAVEGVLPDLRSRDSLLGVRHLMANVPTDTAGYIGFRLQEERRLAYTAMTRARRRVIWSATSTGFEEGEGVPSRFLALVAGTLTTAEAATAPPIPDRPVTPAEAESWLRRRLVDPAEAAPTRAAIVTVLAHGPRWGMRPPDAFAGVRARGPDQGLVAQQLTMSPSQAERYETCPRRYVLERRLKVGDDTNVYATFGSMIHAVLEEVEREALARGDQHGTFPEAVDRLDDHFDPVVFGGGAFAEAWYERAVTALRRLYELWPSRGAVVALERELQLTIDGVAWRGFADRIESDGMAMTIVDYKTSKTAMTMDDAAGSLQLGYYLLATNEDTDLAEFGPAHRAELWYPLVNRKTLATRHFDPDRLPEVEARLAATAAGIGAEDWTPRPGPQCDRCRLRAVCPAQPEGREAYA